MSESSDLHNQVLVRWNGETTDKAIATILPCNGSPVWAEALVGQRPFRQTSDLLAAADVVWRHLLPDQRQVAFDSHPRLGQSHAASATAQSLRWSTGEQSRLSEDHSEQQLLLAANREYERRFGRIFLLCASGKGTAEVLAALERRLGNDPEAEFQEAAEQQRRITQLRLRRWLELPVARCEDV